MRRHRRGWNLDNAADLEACLDACRSGNSDALKTIFEHCERQVRRAVINQMRRHRPHHWQDAIQRSLAEAARAFPRFRGESSPCSWMVTIATRQAQKERDRLERRVVEIVPENAPAVLDLRYAPHSHIEAVDAIRTKLLDELDEETREVLMLRYVEGCTVDETARLMHRSKPFVEKRITLIKGFFLALQIETTP